MYYLEKSIRYLWVLILLTFFNFSALAQERTVKGVVVSLEEKESLPGVSVVIKGTTQGTVTDVDGSYSLNVPNEDAVLVFSYVGYTPEEVVVGTKTTINMELAASLEALSEIVVVGYGTQRKKDLTGSVASVSMKEIENMPITRADQMLQGRISGVQVTQTNAAPGGNISIRIRGTNSINAGNEPLFVIDGFPGAGNLNSINPNDIESIDVLKDASATAIYGSRGANGVVIITTKKGKAGQNNVNFEAYYGVQQVRKKYDLMNATEFATYLNEVQTLNNLENSPTATDAPLPYTEAEIAGLGEGTDWQDEIFRVAPMSNYQLGFNGGNEATRYNLSFNYFDQQGIIINSGLKRASVRLNLDRKVSKKLNFTFTSQITRSWEKQALVNTAGGSSGGVVMDAMRMNPAVPVRDENGEYTLRNAPLPYVGAQEGNPVAYANRVSDKNNVFRGLLNAAGEYEIIDGLKLRISAGTDMFFREEQSYIPSGLWFGNMVTNGIASRATDNNYSWINENTLTYDKQINDNHSVNIVAGASVQEFSNSGYDLSAREYFTDALGTNELSYGAQIQGISSNKSSNALASYFGRVNYRLKDKYLLTVTMRADGSSRFGENKKWGYFPSAAFAWRVIDESFMQNLTTFSDLKLRASYGLTGNQEIGSYNSITRYQNFGGHSNRTDYVSGSNRMIGVARANIGNSDLSWESTASFDIGIDVGLLQNRISFTADYYYKKTTDLLLNVSIPATSGHGSILLNAGSVSNKGFELGLNAQILQGKKLNWSSSINFSRNRNEVLDLSGETERFVGSSSSSIFAGSNPGTNVLRVGEPMGSFYGYQFLGIWQTPEEIAASGMKDTKIRPGDPRYADLDGNGLINGDDRSIIGRSQPDFIYGFVNNLSYGPLTLTVLIQGVQGTDILNLNRYELENGFTTTNKVKSVKDSWTGPGTSNTMPKANSVVRRSTGVTSDIVENGSFLRVKTITLGYDIPLPSSIKNTIKSASIYVTGQNLITFTKYSGYDPEVNSFGSETLSPNTDYNAYPSSKTYIAGIRFGF